MERLSLRLLDLLDLETAVDEEAQAWRNLVPREPWLATVAQRKTDVAQLVRDRLAAGAPLARDVHVGARKPGHGTRPVPISGVVERVAYRALTKHILPPLELPDRSPEAYKGFLQGPITHAFAGMTGTLTLGDASIQYVVEADITAFYEYVNHELLRRQLELLSNDLEAIDRLVDLLGETQGRGFGLPQLLDPSDWLSDVYIQIVERDLRRRGLHLWRYNDDFRIAAVDYAEAVTAIELLQNSARSIGLVVSEQKTYTPLLWTYLMKNTGKHVSDATTAIDPTDVEVIVTDYPNLDDDEVVEAALNTIARLALAPDAPDAIDLKNVSLDDVRSLRRAISSLTKHGNDGALGYIVRLITFIPSLTPRICDYLMAVHDPGTEDAIKDAVETLVGRESLGEWQAMWIVHVCRVLRFNDAEAILPWIRQQRERGRGRPLGAEAALSLGESEDVSFDDLDEALRSDPSALAPWYMRAMTALAAGDPPRYQGRLDAVIASDPLYRLLA